MIIVNTPIFVFPLASTITPILKNNTIVTVLDRKFVMMIAKTIRITTTANGGSPLTKLKIFPNHGEIPVFSADSGVANTDTVPAKMIGGQATSFIAAGTFRIGLPSIRTRASTTIASRAGITTPMLFR